MLRAMHRCGQSPDGDRAGVLHPQSERATRRGCAPGTGHTRELASADTDGACRTEGGVERGALDPDLAVLGALLIEMAQRADNRLPRLASLAVLRASAAVESQPPAQECVAWHPEAADDVPPWPTVVARCAGAVMDSEPPAREQRTADNAGNLLKLTPYRPCTRYQEAAITPRTEAALIAQERPGRSGLAVIARVRCHAPFNAGPARNPVRHTPPPLARRCIPAAWYAGCPGRPR